MNARQAIQQNEAMINAIIERAQSVMKVRGISLNEAIEYGRGVEMKYSNTDSQKAAIDLRFDQAKKIVSKNKSEIYYKLKDGQVLELEFVETYHGFIFAKDEDGSVYDCPQVFLNLNYESLFDNKKDLLMVAEFSFKNLQETLKNLKS